MAARLRSAPYLWVVAASAHFGVAALRAGRPYGCWLATGLETELASRRALLTPSRRAALALSERGLLSIEKHVLQGAECVFGTSPASIHSLEDAGGLPYGSVAALPIPVDIERLTPVPEDQWRAGLERPTLVFLGRGGDPRKNVGLLVDAFRLLRERIPSVRLLLVGERPALALPEGAEATGPVPDVAAELARGSVFVLPSRQEGFGIVVAEAFAAGLPAVVTPSGGPEDLVRESGGGVVLEGFTSEELAATLEQLLGDAGRLAAMRRAARSYVEVHHSRARLEQLLVDAFERLERQAAAKVSPR